MLWPSFLWLLGLIPLIIGGYIWIQRRRRPVAVRYSSLSLVRSALSRTSLIRRYLPFALLLLAVAALSMAMTRPVTIIPVPTNQTSIILAMDVSRSMCSTDIEPNRLRAAEEAALAFIERQAPGTQIGIVAFAGFAELLQLPTTDQEVLADVIESLITGRRTAIGSAILESIDTLAEIDESIAPVTFGSAVAGAPTPVPSGAYVPGIIVVLTDGASNAGPQPIEAAQQAADRGIRVYTIGFGTERGGMMNCSAGEGSGGDSFSGFGFNADPQFGGGGGGFRRGIDEATLQEVADMTGGAYYAATSASELQDVFRSLPTHLITRHEVTEVGFIFTSLGALFAIVAIGLALWWNPLP